MIKKIKPSAEKYFEILLKLNSGRIEAENDKLVIGMLEDSNFKGVKENLNKTIDELLKFFDADVKSKDVLDANRIYACNIEIKNRKGEDVLVEIADGLVGEPKYFAFIMNKGKIGSLELAEIIGHYVNYISRFFNCKSLIFASGTQGDIRKIGFIIEEKEPLKLQYVV
ncbi:MAG: hypothetical protein OH319_03235 [Candidatus Parvarchaeota archaeon]|nr:hypothetical protein [Candidatus Jingweiarchaeum tengchongense]MCW1298509.1 hypothetical protein [Candidatus Jingweiarchaeum tengchongense]MCW1300245.1 hypothetical protein [Candidatus Jingweiarchaeum tengchongense]MCW1304521.1 hypothetical protein [Candidatus Jingweiarchaeum tengchongense]MCW1305751.1 hypothetical protein [Candidatus Jingweiarchaeum tengchongense]